MKYPDGRRLGAQSLNVWIFVPSTSVNNHGLGKFSFSPAIHKHQIKITTLGCPNLYSEIAQVGVRSPSPLRPSRMRSVHLLPNTAVYPGSSLLRRRMI